MAAERQQPTQLGWRSPRLGWTAAAVALGGPFNPLAILAGLYLILIHARADIVGASYFGAAAPGLLAAVATLLAWRGREPGVQLAVRWVAIGVIVGSVLLAIGAAWTLERGALDERINLSLAVFVLSLIAGLVIAASSVAMVRFVALKRRLIRKSSSRDRVVQPRDVMAEEKPV